VGPYRRHGNPLAKCSKLVSEKWNAAQHRFFCARQGKATHLICWFLRAMAWAHEVRLKLGNARRQHALGPDYSTKHCPTSPADVSAPSVQEQNKHSLRRRCAQTCKRSSAFRVLLLSQGSPQHWHWIVSVATVQGQTNPGAPMKRKLAPHTDKSIGFTR